MSSDGEQVVNPATGQPVSYYDYYCSNSTLLALDSECRSWPVALNFSLTFSVPLLLDSLRLPVRVGSLSTKTPAP